jgi:glycine/D-amino acid oxidase-like deaminating enzyme
VHVVVVGAGVFGSAAALELRRRGPGVTLVDTGVVPHPFAESTDVSKVVRLDYGDDETYTAMMERALERWRAFNGRTTRPLFHETGVLFVTRDPMQPGGFEHESFVTLGRRGHGLERLDRDALRRRFPAFRAEAFSDGYFNPNGGWVESGAVVAQFVRDAEAAGVKVVQGLAIDRLLERGSRVAGVAAQSGDSIEADVVVVAAGAWTPRVCPWLAPHFSATAQPVFHLTAGAAFDSPKFVVFCADISRTGWYGFPRTSGIVKVANHGVGRPFDPESSARETEARERAALSEFTQAMIPALAEAPVASSRVCVYGDSADGHFWIAPDPEREGLVVAAGGSGHGFKFAPVLGDLIADAVEGHVVPRFRWRPEVVGAAGEERARAR